MFLGQQRIFLGSEQHLIIPEQFRRQFGEGVYVTRGFEQNLLLMDESIFQELYQRVTALNIADPQARLLLRLIIGNASRMEMDESGRVNIAEELRSFVGWEKEVIMVGQGNYIEVWAPAAWEKQTARLLNTETNSERFAHLDITLQS